MKERYGQWQHMYRLRKIRMNAAKEQETYANPLLNHLFLLNKAVRKGEGDVLSFLITTVLLFVATFSFTIYQFTDFVLSLVISILASLVPYLFLVMRLQKLRHLMEEDFLNIVQSLTHNYNANQYDMYYSLVATQKSIRDKKLRSVMLNLISDLHAAKNEEELRRAIDVFIYTAGTSWAKRLGNIIIKSYLNNENVLQTLLKLTRQIEKTEEMLEQEKSHTADVVLNGYSTVPIFIASLVLGYYMSGAQDWVSLQFHNQWSLLSFTLSLVGVVFSVITAVLIKRPKNDL